MRTGTSRYLGGLVGYHGSGTVKNCYAIGRVSNATNIGGLIGHKSGTVTGCYYDNQTSGCTDENKGLGLSTSDMKIRESFVDWDFADTWAISANINSGYPYLKANVPTDIIPVSNITLDKSMITATVGDTIVITATVTPANATNKAISWTSSNNNLATVINGVVTAKAQGTVVITATTADGGKTASCTIAIGAAPADITPGDVNSDGDVDFMDALAVLKYDAGMSTLSDDKLRAADVNGDGEVDFMDAIKILKFDSGLIPSLD